ncbi:MAG: PAS domain S-box protein, partial [Nitrososphaera sp.]|nr:PAS domain S-box protein [Nitrososphaera sp.]
MKTRNGYVLGSLCLYDNKPREFSKREVELLGLFSQRVMAHLEFCRELEHVRASEAKFRSIAESAHDGLVVIEENERIIEVNPAVEAMFGWSREELLGQPVEVIMPERYRKRHHESIARFIELGASDKFNRSRQFEALRRDGTEFPIEISISGFSVGGSWTFTAFIRDITERKRAEEDLHRNTAEVLEWKNRYEAAIQASGQVLYDWNPRTNDVTYGGNIEKILGYSTQELNGSVNHWIDLIHPDDRNLFNAEVERNLSTKEPAHLEYRIRKKNGDYITVEDTGYFCFDDKGNPNRMVGFVVDTTERKRTEEAARKRAGQIIHYQNALLQLAKIDNSDMDLALKRITEIDAKTLEVERVSIWRYNEDRSEIVCENLYKFGQNIHEKGFRLEAKQYPSYFQAMEGSRTITANDACTDPCTSEFSEGYLKPLGITSMMDVPIWLHGRVVGVVCHEHIGPMRAWTLEEQDFGASIADMVSLTLEATERKRAEEALAEQAIRDALTNLYNRRYFNHRIREELTRADRHQ